MVVDQRRAGLCGLVGADDVRTRLVVDLDQLGGVLGLLERLGDDQGHGVADVPDAALRQHRPGRLAAWRAVPVVERHQAGHVAEAGLLHVVAGEDDQHARCLGGGRDIDLPDVGMGMRRAQHIGACRGGLEPGIVGVAPAAGEQARILDPADRLTNAELCHLKPSVLAGG